MAFENLTINITANSRDARRDLQRTEDQVEDLGDEAQQTSASFTALGASVGGAGVAVGSFNSSVTGTVATLGLLGAGLTGAGAAAAGLAGAVGAVGAAFAGLGLAGAVTHTQELKEAWAATRPEIIEALEPLGEVFGPLLVDAVESLDELTERVVASVGSTEEFRRVFEDLGAIAFDVIPALTGGLFDIARAALPAIRDTVDFLLANGGDAFGVISEAVRRLLPEFQSFARAAIDFLPTFTEFGVTVAETVLPPLTTLIDILDGVLETFNDLPGAIQETAIALGGLAAAGSALGLIGGGGGLLAGLGGGGAAAAGGAGAGAAAGGAAGGLALSTVAGGALAVGVTTFLGSKALEDIFGGEQATRSDRRRLAGNPRATAPNDGAVRDPIPLNPPQARPASLPSREQMVSRQEMNITVEQLNANSRAEGRAAFEGFANEAKRRGVMNTSRGNR